MRSETFGVVHLPPAWELPADALPRAADGLVFVVVTGKAHSTRSRITNLQASWLNHVSEYYLISDAPAPSAWTQSLRYAVAVDWTAAHGFERAPDRRGRGQALSRDAATQVVARLARSRAVAKALARDGRGGAGEDGGAVCGNGVCGVGAGSSKDATSRRRAKEGGAAYREADAMRPGPLPHVFARGVPGELFVFGGDAGDAEELVEIHRVVDFS